MVLQLRPSANLEPSEMLDPHLADGDLQRNVASNNRLDAWTAFDLYDGIEVLAT